MYAKAKSVLFALLLPLAACVMGAEDALTFPTYIQGETVLSSQISVSPVFSGFGNYGLVASGDTLYHMELRHGRVHGKTALSSCIVAVSAGIDETIFVLTADQLVRIDGFAVTKTCDLPGECIGTDLSVCSGKPVVLLDDGSLVMYNSELVQTGNHSLENPDVTGMQGFPGTVVTGYADGTLLSLSVPDFSMIATESQNGSIVFLAAAGKDKLIFSTDAWNEVAVCSPQDLVIQEMFTFQETPSAASSDSLLSCIFAVCPDAGIQVCMANGEIAWRSDAYGRSPLVVLSGDCENALICSGNVVTLLVK